MVDLTDIKVQIDELRKRSQSANKDELEGLLNEARALLKKAFQTEHEEDARQIFRSIRETIDQSGVSESSSFAKNDAGSDLAKRIQRERARSETGSMEDLQLAINGLGDILKQTDPQNKPIRTDALSVLKMIADKGPVMSRKVEDLLKSEEFQQTGDITDLLIQLGRPQSSPSKSEREIPEPGAGKATSVANDSSSSGGNTQDKLASARRKFYAGEYYDAIDILSEVLRVEPNNQEARDRITQAEDNIKRGFVPDTRVPFEARVAYGRATSLERAKKYEEAKEFYNKALEEGRKGGPELANWPSAIEALLRIEQEIIAQQTLDEADALMRQDKWREAMEKYEIVLKLSPGEMKAQKNLELLRKVQEQFEKARIQLTAMTGSLSEMAQMVIELKQSIQSLRPQMSDSKMLESIDADINAKARNLKNRMIDRANNLLTQVTLTPAISERKRMLTEATKLLDQSYIIVSDEESFELAQTASLDLAKVTEAERALVDARRYINSNTEQDSRMAKDKLREIREYNQDPNFRQLVAMLLRQYVSYAEDAIRDKRFELAIQWVSGAKEEPFKVLGRSDEIYRLEQDIETGKRRPWVLRALYAVGIILTLVFAFTLTKQVWQPVFEPTFTPTVTVTPTSIPSTSTPTLEPTATFTPEPTLTPTPLPIYAAIKEDSVAHLLPSLTSPYAFYLKASELVEILESTRDATGALWYKVRFASGSSALEGWVQGVYVNASSTPIP